MGMDLTIDKTDQRAVTGNLTLYAGTCRSQTRPFSGELKAGYLEGRVRASDPCSELTLRLARERDRLSGTMEGAGRSFEVQLSK